MALTRAQNDAPRNLRQGVSETEVNSLITLGFSIFITALTPAIIARG